jgi:hypothetical protein
MEFIGSSSRHFLFHSQGKLKGIVDEYLMPEDDRKPPVNCSTLVLPSGGGGPNESNALVDYSSDHLKDIYNQEKQAITITNPFSFVVVYAPGRQETLADLQNHPEKETQRKAKAQMETNGSIFVFPPSRCVVRTR